LGQPSEGLLVLSDADFKREVQANREVVVDLWAEWCYPCKMLSPILSELAAEYEGRVVFAKLNVDENPRTPEAYDVMAIPTLLVFKDGALKDRIVGAMPKAPLKAKIDGILS